LERSLSERTRLIAVVHLSNALGTINPVMPNHRGGTRAGIPVLVDGAQSAAHLKVDVQALGCDFFVLSGHKLFGPTGIGVLYGREELLERMPPWQGGGDMISTVTFAESTWGGPAREIRSRHPQHCGRGGPRRGNRLGRGPRARRRGVI
jgi:cysteine desulfurase/selenocysteine lyase